jgi:hypothetical protein
MMPDKVLYTDGHDVTVTDTKLQVKNHEYLLNGVTRCAVTVLQPRRAPGVLLLIAGLALIVCGLMGLIPAGTIPDVAIGDKLVGVNTLAVWVGAAFAVIGLLILAIVRERYAVRIATAEGEKDAVVSDKKEYINQIADAINQAVTYVRTRTASKYFTVKSTT